MMKTIPGLASMGTTALAALLMAGCASDSATTTRPQAAATVKAAPEKPKKKGKYIPVATVSKVKFGEFARVEVKATTIDERHANHKGNQDSAAKIDFMLQSQLRIMFAEVVPVAQGADFSKPSARTLQIAPHIKDIRLIAVGTRVWLGVMAGDSDLLMQVTYRDSMTGEVVADPEFAANNNAWSGGWTMGATDNQIRDNVVREIMGYMVANK